ncbi:hypothetical protein GGI25_006272 [Coemansia spiralis]|uniref:Uncharacterized protein n=2 Tax=Coemansia TaxID=4863 RepID=A0A9W8KVN5_9FUNG|nr:hypothetical protein BX070DRAFT_232585 [Coemansia spiralis]KAJ1986706.1 hypothetical protein EDC05_006192 [Coemansia umbellata]KAJ2618813.1 hypothetical protein GGI26_006329 [Coemansia sp. RSA 1358]KAJ2669075.1 hypothetical protein GGI25_006272 [Coemansia spiralis]
MPSFSTFQTLPIHIAKAIAGYTVGNYRIRVCPDYAVFVRERQTWLMLYKVSQLWRELAMRYFCHIATLDLSPKTDEEGFMLEQWPLQTRPADSVRYYHLVKEVNIVLEFCRNAYLGHFIPNFSLSYG